MTPERVDLTLKSYREAIGRCGHLATEINIVKRDIAREAYNTVDMLASPKAQTYTDMPHSSTINKPTEQLGIMLAEGYKSDYQRELESKLAALEAEYTNTHVTIEYVQSWLEGLNETDRWIIETQVISQISWREVVSRYRDTFKEPLSKDTLKRIKEKALQRIYKIAE